MLKRLKLKKVLCRFYEDLQDFLELMPKKDVLFIIGDWNAKIGSKETPGGVSCLPGKQANLALEYGMKQGKASRVL